MMRYLCWLGVLGVVAVPDWAAACRPMGGAGWGPPPVYSPPVCSYPIYVMPVCPPPYYAAPPVYQPFPGPMMQPPRVEAVPRMAAPTPAPPPSGTSGQTGRAPAPGVLPGSNPRPPMVEAIRPAGGSDTVVAPPPKADPGPTTTNPELKFPVVEIPKGLQLDPKPLEQPKGPNPATKPPTLELPKEPEFRPAPKSPSLELPKDPVTPAVPSAAPASPEPLIPPPSIPSMPDSKKPEGFPPLVLPPDTPSQPKNNERISRSSPLAGNTHEVSVSVFPANGSTPARGGYRTVGFYNHTDRDLSLTIEGRAVKLPGKSYLHAKLGPTFTWSHGTTAAMRETVPDGATGIDVVFRD